MTKENTPQKTEGFDFMPFLKTVAPLIFIGFVTAFFGEFVIRAIEANVAINMGIILAATYGAVLILIRLMDAQKDHAVIARFGREANAGADMAVLLEEPWVQARYVRHYLSHIASMGGKNSANADRNAIEDELHALQKEYDNKLELPQFLVGFMIAMGLLGTFIGLLETLTGISGMLDGLGGANGGDLDKQFLALVGELRKPLAGMGIAFSASMFGLITSLVLALMMINIRRYIGHVISTARNVMHDLVDISTINSGDLVPRGEQAPTSIASGISATMLVGRFDLLAKKIEMIVDAIQTSTSSTQRLVDLLGFGPRMRELSEKNLEELRLLSTRYGDSQKAMQVLVDVSQESLKVTGGVTAGIRQMSETMTKVDETNMGSARHLWEIKEKLGKLSENFTMVELIASGVSSQTVLLEALIEEMRRIAQQQNQNGGR